MTAIVTVVVILGLWFGPYALDLGWRGLTTDLSAESRLFSADAPLAGVAIAVHMIAGAAITVLVPVQLIGPLRRRATGLHRTMGVALCAAGLATALGGLGYIALRGTVGGAPMSAAFALYGALTALSAAMVLRSALAGDRRRHRAWTLRFFVLAIGSWLYRLHYALWEVTTGGAASNDAFTGAFDRVNVWAFFVPYLIAVELWLRRRPAPTVA
jgi:hypothetical protein